MSQATGVITWVNVDAEDDEGFGGEKAYVADANVVKASVHEGEEEHGLDSINTR